MNPTLYEKIGGKETVVKAAKFLYVNVLRDGYYNNSQEHSVFSVNHFHSK